MGLLDQLVNVFLTVLTIGTGLGNARFTNRRKDSGRDEKAKKGRD